VYLHLARSRVVRVNSRKPMLNSLLRPYLDRGNYSYAMLVDEAKYIAGKRTSDGSALGDQPFTWIGLVDASEAEL